MKQISRPRPALRLISGVLILAVLGTLGLLTPWATTRPLEPLDAAFTAVSAVSVTGLSVITPAKDLTLWGQIFLLLLIQVGGIGYMVLAVTALRAIGRSVALADRLALKDSLGLLNPGGIIQLTRYVLRTVLLIETVGALLLWLHWRTIMPDGRAAFYAIFHSISSFCNAGFDLFTGHPDHMRGLPMDGYTLGIMGTLIFLGGLGIPVLFDFVTWPSRKQFSLHTRITMPLVLTLVVAGAAAIYLSEFHSGVLAGEPTASALGYATFQSVSARTAGYAGVPDFSAISPGSQLVIGCLMFIGCAPASMGGGSTTGTLATLVISVWAFTRGRREVTFKGRTIPDEMIRKAAAVLTVSILLVCLATWLLVITQNATLPQAGFEVISGFSTSGLTLDLTSKLNPFGQGLMMFVMIWGRLGALTIVLALANAEPPARYSYPEEKILIG